MAKRKKVDPEYRTRIKDAFDGNYKLRLLLDEIPGISHRRVNSYIANKKKNGLVDFTYKSADGMLYCKLDDFVAWVERGMRPPPAKKKAA